MRALMMTIVLLTLDTPAEARDVLVHDQPAYTAAAKHLQPGDRIILADGEWRDFRIHFDGEGTEAAPLTLTAQTPGKVILTGQSSLNLAGRHLIVSDLVFRDGHPPGEELIAFRDGTRREADDSRLTGIVIDTFSKPDRADTDHWVSLYGRNNRVDHSHFVGKTNGGAMMVVVRATPLDNHHRIDHNYFGPRPELGENGGETIRIGTSEQSQSDSFTTVEDNFFERCDGEVEIVSVKSGANIMRRNVFVESQGALTLRHGHGNLVEDNVFFGNGLPKSGGIRVINERQTVRNNYLEGLAGTGSFSALALMNGVPNSPLNRYMQVRAALIEHNSVIDAARVTLGSGANQELTLPPVSTRFVANLFVNRNGPDPFRAHADIGGISFSGDLLYATGAPALSIPVERRTVPLARAANGLLYPTDPALARMGTARTLQPIRREETGVSWYAKPAASPLPGNIK
ncbi:MAG: polysaccharide lyase 6 family protein [Sphingomonas sp.]|jgi:poly(beta-D-mannuronate) lyase|uniref:polysaccharide lyase 6 family protein n=1 Tax=Sphingomonas sp. TaxID=28214 RepID=UPI0035690D19